MWLVMLRKYITMHGPKNVKNRYWTSIESVISGQSQFEYRICHFKMFYIWMLLYII
jgi:hypothetical protein